MKLEDERERRQERESQMTLNVFKEMRELNDADLNGHVGNEKR